MFSTPGQDAGTPKQGAYAGGMDQAGNGEELGTQRSAKHPPHRSAAAEILQVFRGQEASFMGKK
eukprot:scaffold96947_cov45-Phaeocystis_antarctica.AAC.1